MPIARSQLIDQSKQHYYHVYSRCVQQERLCGYDPKSGYDYSHRKQFMIKRLFLLSSVFPVDLTSYAILDDHYHLTLLHAPQRVDSWDDETVVRCWLAIHQGPTLMRQWFQGKTLTEHEQAQVNSYLEAWRHKLKSLSYFMKCFNEKLSKEFNKEFNKKGRFWEERFQSKPLDTDADLIMCMSYVDLNPVHAGIADTPDDSLYTSFREREQQAYCQSAVISEGLNDHQGDTLAHYDVPAKWLMPFKDQAQSEHKQTVINLTYQDYRAFVYWVGQCQRTDNKGSIQTTSRAADKLGVRPIDFEPIKCQFYTAAISITHEPEMT